MKKLRLLMVALLSICTVVAYSQKITVSGTVSDAQTGEPIAFAAVMLKGTTTVGVSTDDLGKFSIEVPSTGTLLFSFIGYTDQEVAINGRTALTVKMQPDAVMLQDVMVVAYGTADKKSFSGSASTIGGDKISKRPISNVTQALAGMASGVQITSSTGQPGESAAIRVRGVGSISAGSSPLIVLDGVPYDGVLGSIAANDIESMTVLKDAAANSMYGARGANGVLMITTKKGQSGKTIVNVEIRGGFNDRGVPAHETIKDPGEYLELAWESLNNFGKYGAGNKTFLNNDPANIAASKQLFSKAYGTGGYYPFGGVAPEAVIDPKTGKLNPQAKLMYQDDWMKVPFRKGFRQEYIASMSGGNEKTSFYISASYLDDQGYTVNSYFKRFATRGKVEHQATKWFKLGLNISYAKSFDNKIGADINEGGYSNLFLMGQQLGPIYPVYQYNQTTGEPLLDKNGNKLYDYGDKMGKRPFGSSSHPIAQQIHDINGKDRDHTTALGFAEIRFLKDFKFTANVSIESNNYFENAFKTPIGGDAAAAGGRNTRGSAKMFSINSQQLLSYNKTINKHNIDILLGHETNSYKTNYMWATKENFLIPDNPELNNASKITGAGSYSETKALNSYFARGQYNYNSKYYFTASYRRDGSSRFHPSVRWGGFWSVGGSWRIEQEEFLKQVKWIDALKLRVSYGTQGNDNVATNAYQDLYQVSSSAGQLGITYSARGNKNLTWEKSQNFNVGLDMELFGNLRATVEFYNKTTKDLLYSKPLPASWGSPSTIYENTIDMRNYGFEVELSYDIIKNQNLTWSVNANITHQKNKLLKLPTDKDPDGKGYMNGSYYYKVGGSLYDYYVREFAGVDPETGVALYYKDILNPDGSIKEVQKVKESSNASYRLTGQRGLVDYYGGLSTYVAWKGIDLSIQTTYQIGGYGSDSNYSILMGAMSAPGYGLHVDSRQRWTTPGQITSVPKLEYGANSNSANSFSDKFLTSKSMFSLQNVTLGYSFPASVINKLGVTRLRVYATGDNLWLGSARKGFDPRTSFGGGQGYIYSATRTISLGINLTF